VSRSEEPTPRRLRRAFDAGDVPLSASLVRSLCLVVALGLAPGFVSAVRLRFGAALKAALEHPERASAASIVHDVVTLTAPLLVVVAVTALVVGGVQTGGAFALPFASTRREGNDERRSSSLFDVTRLGKALRGGLAVGIAVVVAALVLEERAPALAGALGRGGASLDVAGMVVLRAAWVAAAVLAALSFADAALARAAWLERLKMTPYEVKEEQRETAGDPGMRRARKRIHDDIAR
jgi:flagellar biosynthesis protein FlhB